MLLLTLLTLTATAHEPPPWPGQVRLQSAEAVGDGPFSDPALTDGRPADDRELAWDALRLAKTRRTTWYQHVPVLAWFRPLRTVDPNRVDMDASSVQDFLREHGFPQATVTPRIEPAAGRRRDVIFEVHPGPGTYTGLRHGAPDREPGWKVKPVADALSRGAAMSLYGGVHAAWTAPDDARDELDLHAEVGVRAFVPGGTLSGNIGSWSDLHADWSHDLTRQVAWRQRIGGWTDLWPWVNSGGPRASTTLIFTVSPGLSLELGAEAGYWTSWTWRGQRDGYDPWFEDSLGDGRQQFLSSYATARANLALIADSTDRRVYPRRGARVELRGAPIGWAAGAPLFRADLDARAFLPIVGQRWIVSLRGRAGALEWRDEEGRALLGERLFLGGKDMRGWGRRRIVPPSHPGDAASLRIGGDVLAFASADLRWHVHRDLVLVAFGGAGRVWERVADMRLDDLVANVGLSGASPTPLGALQVDVVMRVKEQEIDGGFPLGINFWLDLPW